MLFPGFGVPTSRLLVLAAALVVALPAAADAAPLQVTSRVDLTPQGSVFEINHATIVGDFTGDGIDDEAYSPSHGRSVVIVPGRSNPANVDLVDAPSTIRFTAAAEVSALSSAGDFDGDGRDDLLVLFDGTNVGSWILFGGAGGLGTSTPITAGPRITKIATGGQYYGRGSGLGDFDGDGFDDVVVERTAGSGANITTGVTVMRGGPRVTSLDATKQNTRTTALLNGTRKCSLYFFVPVCSVTAPVAGRAGDFNGDGRADLAVAMPGASTYLVLGRTGAFSASATAPGTGTSRFASVGGTGWVPSPIGDVDGDGRDDLMFGTQILFGRGAPASVIPATEPVTKLQTSVGVPVAYPAGDQDGDGSDDLLVALRVDAGAAPVSSPYVLVTHVPAAGSTINLDPSAQGPRQLAGLPDTVWQFSNPGDIDGDDVPDLLAPGLRVVYRLSHGPVVLPPSPTTPVPTTPTPTTPTPTTPAPTTPTPTTPAPTTPTLPAGVLPPGIYDSRWVFHGSPSYTVARGVALTSSIPGQVGSYVWPSSNDWNNRTLSFTSIMSGGSGAAEGITLAFVPASGIGTGIGGGGPLLGFGGLPGVAFALDVNQSPGDPGSSFVGITDGVTATGGLRWVATADPGVRLRGTVAVKLVSKDGTVSLYVNGKLRLQRALVLPADALVMFTGSTGPTIAQTAEIRDLVITTS